MRMEALAATRDVRAQGLSATGPGLRLGQTVVAMGLALLALAGLLLVVRRAGGALAQPLPPEVLVLVALCLASAALIFRRIFAASAIGLRDRYLLWSAPTLALALWVCGLTLPGSSTWAMTLFCGIVLLEEGWSWGRFYGQTGTRRSPATEPAIGRTELAEPGPIDLVSDGPAEYDETVSQQVVRRRDESGEVLEGWVRVDFLAGQRIAAAHLAICPPLERAPACEAEQQDGPAAQVKVTQSLSYGVRLEVKLDEPAEEATCAIVEFSIQEQADKKTEPRMNADQRG